MPLSPPTLSLSLSRSLALALFLLCGVYLLAGYPAVGAHEVEPVQENVARYRRVPPAHHRVTRARQT